jgi:hypothetical protein
VWLTEQLGSLRQRTDRVRRYVKRVSWRGLSLGAGFGIRPTRGVTRMWRFYWRRSFGWTGAGLVGDCEAFLRGNLAERLIERGADVPVWAWMNVLAHGTEDDVRSVRCVRGGDQWEAARSYLATEVLELVSADRPLVEVQRDLLVPLEEGLASRVDVSSWSAHQLVMAVHTALNGQRRERRKSRIRRVPGR